MFNFVHLILWLCFYSFLGVDRSLSISSLINPVVIFRAFYGCICNFTVSLLSLFVYLSGF